MKRALFIVIHTHEWGCGCYLVRCRHKPTRQEVLDALPGIVFEPERGETITIDEPVNYPPEIIHDEPMVNAVAKARKH